MKTMKIVTVGVAAKLFFITAVGMIEVSPYDFVFCGRPSSLSCSPYLHKILTKAEKKQFMTLYFT
jgi:hypothetical protein